MSKTEIIKLSASAVKTYETCPRKYYYNYIEKRKKREWDHFKLGNFCHLILEIFHKVYLKHKGKKGFTIQKMMSYAFKKARADKEFKNMSEKQLKEAKGLIKEYLNYIIKNGMPNVKGIEEKFSIKLTDDVLVRGFIDRIDVIKDGTLHIVDYKTSKALRYLTPLQLNIYGLHLANKYPNLDNFLGSYQMLRHNSKLKQYTFNKDDLDKCKKELLEYAEKIRNDNEWIPIPSKLCSYCDFQNVCSAFNW